MSVARTYSMLVGRVCVWRAEDGEGGKRRGGRSRGGGW